MKMKNEKYEALLRRLVLEGDAQAFFSLTKSFFLGRYLRELGNGTSVQEASRIVLDNAVALFEQVRHVHSHRMEAWLAEHCSLEAEAAETSEVLIDANGIAATEVFLDNCNKELLRAASAMKRTSRRAGKKFPGVLFKNNVTTLILLFVAVVLIGAGGTFVMVRFHLTVEMRFKSANDSTVVVYPPEVWSGGDALPGSQLPAIETHTEDTGTVSDTATLPADTLSGASLSLDSSSVQPAVSAKNDQRRRSLPPVTPKARFKRPPPPPVEPLVPSATEEIVEPVQQPSISPTPSSVTPVSDEPELMN